MNPFDIAIPELDDGFRYLKRPLADGMRASTAAQCASCAIIEYLNPDDERVGSHINDGVAFMGHLLHQAWAYGVFQDVEYQVEAPIVWAHGVSHDDVIVHEGPWAGVYEVKTHSDAKPKAPSAANHRQAEFRLRLRELGGDAIPGPARLVMIGKAGKESGWVRGPWEVALTDERRAEIDGALGAIDTLMQDARAIDLHGDTLKALSDGCTRCFPKPVVPAVGGLDGLLGKYARIKREFDEYDGKRKQYHDAKKELAVELVEVRDQIAERVGDGVTHESMHGHTATRNKAGSLIVKLAEVAA